MTIGTRAAKAALVCVTALLALGPLLVVRASAAGAAASVQVDGWGGWTETHATDEQAEHSFEGDIAVFQLTVTNSGSENLSGFSVTDNRVSRQGHSWRCSQQVLRPGDSMFCYAGGDYVVTAAENDAEQVVTSVRVTATGANAGSVASAPVPITVSLGERSESILPGVAIDTVSQLSDRNSNGLLDAGDTINYGFTVTNVSAAAVANISGVHYQNFDGTGPRPESEALACPRTSLKPRETMRCTIAKAYTVTPADVQSGAVDSLATVDGSSPAARGVLSHEDVTSLQTQREPKRGERDSESADRNDSSDRDTESARREPPIPDEATGAEQPGSSRSHQEATDGEGLVPAAEEILTSPRTFVAAPAALALASIGLILARRRTMAEQERRTVTTHRADRRKPRGTR